MLGARSCHKLLDGLTDASRPHACDLTCHRDCGLNPDPAYAICSVPQEMSDDEIDRLISNNEVSTTSDPDCVLRFEVAP